MSTSQVSSRVGVASEKSESLKEQDVTPLAGKGISVEDLAGSGFTYRHDWGDWNGQHIFPLTSPLFTRNSRVFVAIAEGAGNGGKHMGDARFTLHNVAPNDGEVKIWVNIEYSSPLRLVVDYLVVNP